MRDHRGGYRLGSHQIDHIGGGEFRPFDGEGGIRSAYEIGVDDGLVRLPPESIGMETWIRAPTLGSSEVMIKAPPRLTLLSRPSPQLDMAGCMTRIGTSRLILCPQRWSIGKLWQ
jgi:hypothetical protein